MTVCNNQAGWKLRPYKNAQNVLKYASEVAGPTLRPLPSVLPLLVVLNVLK